jgi:1-acyl-sn-glycerol-3-phosphate acyltransferase
MGKDMKVLLSILATLVLVVSVILWAPVVVLLSLFGNKNLTSWGPKVWCRFVLRIFGIKVRIHGFENYSKDQPCLVASNHQSLMDIPLLVGKIPGHLRMVAKKELFSIPFFGQGMKAAGCIPLDRGNQRSGKEVSDEIGARISQGLQIWVAPEGTRSKDGTIGEFKKGSFAVAVSAHVPVQPVVIAGAIDILNKKSLLPKFGGTIDFSFCPQIFTGDYTVEDRAALAQKTRQVILAEYDRLSEIRKRS